MMDEGRVRYDVCLNRIAAEIKLICCRRLQGLVVCGCCCWCSVLVSRVGGRYGTVRYGTVRYSTARIPASASLRLE